MGRGKQVACPETGPILLSASVTPTSLPHPGAHPSLAVAVAPEATGLRLEVILPTEQTVTRHIKKNRILQTLSSRIIQEYLLVLLWLVVPCA